MKVFLIGYMGSGKSTAGKKLAEKLRLSFIDFDEYIEKQSGKTIPDIFESEGEEKFRSMERKCLEQIVGMDNAVISLGGGTPCFNNNMELINKSGISVYIETGVDDLVKRLIKSKTSRPLIQGLNETDLKKFIEATLEMRLPFYKMARHTVHADAHTVEETAAAIEQLTK